MEVLIHTFIQTKATWGKRTCPRFETASVGLNPGPGHLDLETCALPTRPPRRVGRVCWRFWHVTKWRTCLLRRQTSPMLYGCYQYLQILCSVNGDVGICEISGFCVHHFTIGRQIRNHQVAPLHTCPFFNIVILVAIWHDMFKQLNNTIVRWETAF